MFMPKNYPSILIDRNRKSRSAKHKYDYVVCFDHECGFVARVILFNKDALDQYKSQISEIPNADVLNEIYLFKSKQLGIVLVIEAFLYDTKIDQLNRPRIKSLLGKCMKKYLFAESTVTPAGKVISFESQIQVLEDVEKDLKAGYEKMIAHMGSQKLADFYIANVHAAIETISMFKKISK